VLPVWIEGRLKSGRIRGAEAAMLTSVISAMTQVKKGTVLTVSRDVRYSHEIPPGAGRGRTSEILALC
jgi:hypothetical protein